MKTWHFYDLTTGHFTGRSSTSSDTDQPPPDVPSGQGLYEGTTDWEATCVNLTTGAVDDYIPPSPGDTDLLVWAWSTDIKRWVSSLTVAGRQAGLRGRIEALMLAREAGSLGQARATREVLLALLMSTTPPTEAVTRLNDVDAAMAAWRATIASINAATTLADLDAIEAGL